MGKLIRDRIPELLGDQAGTHRPLDDDAFETALRQKLQEEVQEYLEGGEVMELADILEVVYALAKLDGVTESQLDYFRAEKARDRGAFEQRLYWEGD
ncbi:hypothetical protein D3875_07980 [Deinococcus cavernae]|uniref:Phosphoribosyl-ATP pyrophosphohydrolase n=1 Tax=Deinococcus cavernae TaxID=2320857 RepID=A0A418VC54_9DEIO|nr:nucleoside triphosphate pyrophosphohydrolase [Deinococcus cavernae]RJF73606.1 hypothetical protein D3875_07980 [Deinococcus cavernae]